MANSNLKTSGAPGLVLVLAAALVGALVGGWWLYGQGHDQLLDGENPATGAASAPDRPTQSGPDLVPMGLDADATGAAAGEIGRETPPPADPKAGRLTLAAVDALTGEPVPRFWAKRSGAGEIGRETERFQNSPGEAQIEINLERPPGLLMVLGANYSPREVLPKGPGFLKVELARATSIIGIVRDGASAPVPGARVTLERQTRDPETSAITWTAPEGASLRRTNKEGSYAFANLPPGTYRTSALAGTVRLTSAGQTVTPGEWTTIDHWLPEDGTLSVELVRPDGSPSEKSRIMLGSGEAENGEPILARYTDENGRAVLGPLESGTYEITVLSDHGTLTPLSITLPLQGPAQDGLRLELQEDPQDD